MSRLRELAAGDITPTKSEIVSWIGEVVPDFRHMETSKNLDQRM